VGKPWCAGARQRARRAERIAVGAFQLANTRELYDDDLLST